AAGGSVRYRVHVSDADTLRVRAAVPTGITPTVTVRAVDETQLCTRVILGELECAVPAAGDYLVDVVLGEAATVYTTIDSARTPSSCNPAINVRVNQPGVSIDLPTPGTSWCALVPAAAGDVLAFDLDSNDDDLLHIAIYDDTGTNRCTATVTTVIAEC